MEFIDFQDINLNKEISGYFEIIGVIINNYKDKELLSIEEYDYFKDSITNGEKDALSLLDELYAIKESNIFLKDLEDNNQQEEVIKLEEEDLQIEEEKVFLVNFMNWLSEEFGAELEEDVEMIFEDFKNLNDDEKEEWLSLYSESTKMVQFEDNIKEIIKKSKVISFSEFKRERRKTNQTENNILLKR